MVHLPIHLLKFYGIPVLFKREWVCKENICR